MIAEYLNGLSNAERYSSLLRCCGSSMWAKKMCAAHPFAHEEEVYRQADELWGSLGKDDFLEAFSHHPQIGASKEALREKFQSTEVWSSSEQAGVAQANEAVLDRLLHGNKAYLERFGYIFIVCATGKTAKEMSELLEMRLPNDPDIELRIAAQEQAKITRIRLEKLIQ